jgi:hypothetical protein
MSGVLCDATDIAKEGFASLANLYVGVTIEVSFRFDQFTQSVLELDAVQLTLVLAHVEANIANPTSERIVAIIASAAADSVLDQITTSAS